MATGRTVLKHSQVFIDGYDMTGYSRSFGQLTWSYGEDDATTLSDPVKNALHGVATVNVGTINTVLDNSTGASHGLLNTRTTRVIMLPIGIQATPAQGDPVFMGQFMQKDFMTDASQGTAININTTYSGWAAEGATLLYSKPWGTLLHAKAAKTAVNSSAGVDDNGAATSAKGGFMCYHLFSSNGTVTLKVQDAGTNADGSFSDLVTSGSINASVTPAAAVVALSATATVNKYLRWQLAFGTATTATFSIGFVRQL